MFPPSLDLLVDEDNMVRAIQTIFKEFSILIRDLKLITGDLVAVDGAYLRANASK